MMNMQKMMKEAQKMQKQVQNSQEEINAMEFTGKSAQDLVTAVFSGDKKLKNIAISSDLIDPDDPETLQEMVIAAVNDGLAQIDKTTEQKLGQFAKLPF